MTNLYFSYIYLLLIFHWNNTEHKCLNNLSNMCSLNKYYNFLIKLGGFPNKIRWFVFSLYIKYYYFWSSHCGSIGYEPN